MRTFLRLPRWSNSSQTFVSVSRRRSSLYADADFCVAHLSLMTCWCNDCSLPLLSLFLLLNRSLAVGTKSGYKFFSLSSVDKLEQIYECSKYPLCSVRLHDVFILSRVQRSLRAACSTLTVSELYSERKTMSMVSIIHELGRCSIHSLNVHKSFAGVFRKKETLTQIKAAPACDSFSPLHSLNCFKLLQLITDERCHWMSVVMWWFVCVCLSAADTEDVCIVERLFSSSLVAIVSLKAPRKLKVCHFKKGTEICNYSYSNTILAVKLNRQVR